MSITVSYAMELTVRETLALAPDAQNAVVTHNGYNASGSMNATSTPPASLVSAFEATLVAGVLDVDLTDLTGTNGVAVDGTGKKVQGIKIKNPGTNTNPLTVAPGPSNGYNLLGASSLLTLEPGDQFEAVFYDTQPDVAVGAKVIRLTDGGANGAESHEIIIVLG